LLNAGLARLAQLRTTGAEGSDFPHRDPAVDAQRLPDVADQTAFYRRAYEQAEGRPIVFRTLDIGGDKVLPYLAHTVEDNPAMGWRAIRIGLDRPAMLRQQLRALLRAAGGHDLLVKFPMIAEIAELEAARRLLGKEIAGPREVSEEPRSTSRDRSKCPAAWQLRRYRGGSFADWLQLPDPLCARREIASRRSPTCCRPLVALFPRAS
jgi:phosphotransferase system enzyme I (PtsP)